MQCQYHGIEQHETPCETRLRRRRQESDRTSHRMSGQNDVVNVQGFAQSEEIVAIAAPVAQRVGRGRQCCRAVPPLIDGEDAPIPGQRREDVAIGEGIEARGVQKHEVERAVDRSEVKEANCPLAPSR